MDLPLSPFKHLHWFEREDAEIFFGRGQEIRDLYKATTRPGGAPIVLLFGMSGVGKSSLLAAGVLPRLEAEHQVQYQRRDDFSSLTATLAEALQAALSVALGNDPSGDKVLDDPASAWRAIEERAGSTLIIVLDQVEVAWTRSESVEEELEAFSALLRALFAVRQTRPEGRLVLSFRKEWLAEVIRLLNQEDLPRAMVEIRHLGRAGIAEAIRGAASSKRHQDQYGLIVDEEVVDDVVTDLVEVPLGKQGQRVEPAQVAPVLQILLTEMWCEAIKRDSSRPRFTVELYRELQRTGLHLDDFLEKQLANLEEWHPEVVRSGLALDLLTHHTNPRGTTETRQALEVLHRYGDRPEVVDLLQQSKDRYLLIGTARVQGGKLQGVQGDPNDKGTIRLAHDALAPLIRHRYEASGLPGQRARRLLGNRLRKGGENAVFDDADLTVVEEGALGMRTWTQEERELVELSRRQRSARARARRARMIFASAAILIIVTFAGLTWILKQQATEQARAAERSAARIQLKEGLRLLEENQNAMALAFFAEAARRVPDDPMLNAHFLELLLTRGRVRPTLPLQHQSLVSSAVFSPGGRRVVTASWLRSAQVWDSETGAKIGSPLKHQSAVSSAVFSPDGRWVVTASDDYSAQVWDSKTGAKIGSPLAHQNVVSSAVFSPDGRRVITASFDDSAQVWDSKTGAKIGSPLVHQNVVSSAVFSPDGHRVVTASADHSAQVWDSKTGAKIGSPLVHQGEVSSAVFSPDGRRVVTASLDGSAQVWSSHTGAKIGSPLVHQGEVSSAVFSPDGRHVVTTSFDYSAQIWNSKTSAKIGSPLVHQEVVFSAVFSPDGRWVVTASADYSAQVWNSKTGAKIGSPLRHKNKVSSAVFSPGGRSVVTVSADYSAQVWNSKTGAKIGSPLRHQNEVSSAVFSPDGRRVVTASTDKTAQIWDSKTGAKIGSPLVHQEDVNSAVFSPDGRRVVTASTDKTAQVWNSKTGTKIGSPLMHQEDVNLAVFSPDGSQVVTASADDSAQVWDSETGAKTGSPLVHQEDVNSAIFSPDGRRMVTVSWDNTAQVWDNHTRTKVGSPLVHQKEVKSAVFSPDGRRVVTASWDNTAQVWDTETGEKIGSPLVHQEDVNSAVFSPDGRRVVTASTDKTAQVWDSLTGEKIGLPLGHEDEVSSAVFSPDGRHVVTTTRDKTAQIWDTNTGSIEDAGRLISIAESITGFRIGNGGWPEEVANHQERLEALRTTALQSNAESGLDRTLKWYFTHPWSRTISPLSWITASQYVVRFPEQAKRHFGGHPVTQRCIWPLAKDEVRPDDLDIACVEDAFGLVVSMELMTSEEVGDLIDELRADRAPKPQ
ncbi:MAG: WD40 repeat domain-containing protein [Acidobacteriota bacterium]